jgi:hypothetical protein
VVRRAACCFADLSQGLQSLVHRGVPGSDGAGRFAAQAPHTAELSRNGTAGGHQRILAEAQARLFSFQATAVKEAAMAQKFLSFGRDRNSVRCVRLTDVGDHATYRGRRPGRLAEC